MGVLNLKNEPTILSKLVEGDTLAFRTVYEFYQGRVFAFALMHTKSKQIAEEIVQEIFIKIWEKRQLIDPQNNFENYIIVATRNHILNYFRKVSSDKVALEKLYENIQHLKHEPVEELIEKELARLHQMAIQHLKGRQKEVYILSKKEELTYAQIANQLGLSKETVKTHMQEALKSIRSYVSNHLDFGYILLIMLHSKK